MKQLLCIILLFVFYLPLSAQTDTVYYDKFWEKTSKDNASFYRLLSKENHLYYVRDYYLSGTLQMEGRYASLDPEVQEGYFTFYFENGRKFAEGNYQHGRRVGIWTLWYPDGLKREELKFFGRSGDFATRWRSQREKSSVELVDRAIIKRNRGNTEAAAELLNTAIANNPYSADAFRQRGLLKCSLGDTGAGCADLKKSLEYGFFDTQKLNEEIAKYCER